MPESFWQSCSILTRMNSGSASSEIDCGAVLESRTLITSFWPCTVGVNDARKSALRSSYRAPKWPSSTASLAD